MSFTKGITQLSKRESYYESIFYFFVSCVVSYIIRTKILNKF